VISAYKKVFPEMLQSKESNMNIINSIQEVSRITQLEQNEVLIINKK
jgi:hypothetical protein